MKNKFWLVSKFQRVEKTATILILFVVLQADSGLAQAHKYQDPLNSIYQYSVSIENREAYLWIPPKCKQVRGVIISLANLLERRWLEDPVIRETAAHERLGIIWVGQADPGIKKDQVFTADMREGAGKLLDKMLKDFADESGYREIEFAPIIAMGHSANGQFAWQVPNWNADRTIAAIPVKTMPLPAKLDFEGVPMCYVVGQTTEWPQYRVPDPATQPGDRDFFWPVVSKSAVALRQLNTNNLLSVVVDPGGGHFDWSDRLAKFISLFIHKACQYRLPQNQAKDGPVKLKQIDPKSGWLTDTGGIDPDTFWPAPYSAYKGDPSKAYWFFDEETAMAAAAFDGDRKPRKKQMLTFIQDGNPLPAAKLGFAPLKFEPEKDGMTFKVQGTFLKELPPELLDSGTPLGHASGPIKFKLITGPALQTGPDEFRVQFNRGDYGGDIWLQAEHPGNDEFRHAVQPAKLQIPAVLTKGKEQQITFPAVPDQKGSVKSIKLTAYSSSELPVYYYLISGPAIIQDGLLKIKQVPINTRYPIKITVVAYQWGRILPPQYKSAQSVLRSFLLYK